MPNTRSILIRGVSCSYTETTISKPRKIWFIYKDANNYTQLYLDNIAKTFNYQKCVGGTVTTLSSNAQTFNKWQVFNILCQQTATGMKLSILKNNGTYETYSNSSATYFEGASSLYPLTKSVTGNEADAFLDSIVYLPNMTYDDVTTEAILRGTKEGFEMPELFDINAVTLHTNATRSGDTITLNATNKYQNSYVYIPVLPNNKYELNYNTINGGYMIIEEYYNNILLSTSNSLYSGDTIITNDKTNKVKLRTSNAGITTYTWSNISLKLKM